MTVRRQKGNIWAETPTSRYLINMPHEQVTILAWTHSYAHMDRSLSQAWTRLTLSLTHTHTDVTDITHILYTHSTTTSSTTWLCLTEMCYPHAPMVRSFHDNDTQPWPAIHPGSQN